MVKWRWNNYYCTCCLYGPYNVDVGKSITRAIARGGTWKFNFIGPRTGNEQSECHFGPKKLRFPMTRVMDLPQSSRSFNLEALRNMSLNKKQYMFGTDSDQNRTLEEIPRSGADSLPLIKPLRRTRTLCGQTQTQVWSKSSVDEHNLYFARPAIVWLTRGWNLKG